MPRAVYKIKRLYNGLASIRTTTIDLCTKKGVDLKLIYEGRIMTIPLEKLKNPEKFQIHSRKFRSKFDANQTYELYDFPFVPDDYVDNIGGINDREQIDKLYIKLKERFDKSTDKFVPQFGNNSHILLLPKIKEVEELLDKLKVYKAGLKRATQLGSKIEGIIKNIEFLRG